MLRLLGLTLFLWSPLAAQQTPDPPVTSPPAADPAAEAQRLQQQRHEQRVAHTERWFPDVHRTIETAPGEEEVVAAFPFANPGETPVSWTALASSCTCAKCVIRVGDRVYELRPSAKELVQLVESPAGPQRVPVQSIAVGGHERGQVDVHVHMAGAKVVRIVTLDVHTDDAASPMMRLQVNAMAPKALVVEPQAVDLGLLAPGTRREFSVEVTSPVVPAFEILSVDPLPPYLTARFDKEQRDGRAVWTIRGALVATDRASASDGSVRALLRFRTDVADATVFTVSLQASVGQPVVVRPGMLALGSIRRDKGATASIRFEPRDGSALRAEAVTFAGLTFPERFVTARTRDEDGALVVDVEVSPGAPLGVVRGDVVVRLDHPAAGPYRILFTGFVR